jgi:Rrf2 family iron-sulfur cluster assembly transcriptional regulator
MKISKNGQYALLSVADLALYDADDHQSIAQVAQRQNIDPRYLGQIFFALKNAGIISSLRGKSGGYRLARPAADISAGEVVRALEGDLIPTQCCVVDADTHSCESFDACLTRSLWQAVSHEINDTLDSMTIADIVRLYREERSGNETE